MDFLYIYNFQGMGLNKKYEIDCFGWGCVFFRNWWLGRLWLFNGGLAVEEIVTVIFEGL